MPQIEKITYITTIYWVFVFYFVFYLDMIVTYLYKFVTFLKFDLKRLTFVTQKTLCYKHYRHILRLWANYPKYNNLLVQLCLLTAVSPENKVQPKNYINSFPKPDDQKNILYNFLEFDQWFLFWQGLFSPEQWISTLITLFIFFLCFMNPIYNGLSLYWVATPYLSTKQRSFFLLVDILLSAVVGPISLMGETNTLQALTTVCPMALSPGVYLFEFIFFFSAVVLIQRLILVDQALTAQEKAALPSTRKPYAHLTKEQKKELDEAIRRIFMSPPQSTKSIEQLLGKRLEEATQQDMNEFIARTWPVEEANPLADFEATRRKPPVIRNDLQFLFDEAQRPPVAERLLLEKKEIDKWCLQIALGALIPLLCVLSLKFTSSSSSYDGLLFILILAFCLCLAGSGVCFFGFRYLVRTKQWEDFRKRLIPRIKENSAASLAARLHVVRKDSPRHYKADLERELHYAPSNVPTPFPFREPRKYFLWLLAHWRYLQLRRKIPQWEKEYAALSREETRKNNEEKNDDTKDIFYAGTGQSHKIKKEKAGPKETPEEKLERIENSQPKAIRPAKDYDNTMKGPFD